METSTHIVRRARLRGIVALLTSVLVAIGVIMPLGVVAPAAAAGDSAVLTQQKIVVGSQTQFAPGDRFQYEIDLGCSSTTDPGCANTTITDILPAPLILDPGDPNPVVVTVSPTAPSTITRSGDNAFTVKPLQTFGNATGLGAGNSMTVLVSVQVPQDASADFNGQTLTNTSVATADNAQNVSSSADITLRIPTTLVPSLEKTGSPQSTIPAVPGRPVTWTLTPGNASNQTVDTITVQDPTTPPGPFTYLDLTAATITDPAGTTGRTVEYFVGGAWTTTAPTPLSGATGVRVTFTGAFAPGVTGTVQIDSVTNSTVATIPQGTSVTLVNRASTTVAKAGTVSAPVERTASVVVAATNPDVAITKRLADDTLVAGQSTIADIVATNGAQNVQRLTVTEPSSGQPGFTAQGLEFTGFGTGLEWPDLATSATITYVYSTSVCTSQAQTTTVVDSLPAPTAGCVVEGFTVTFASAGDDIQTGSYAALPLRVTALPVRTTAQIQSTNHVDTTVVNLDGASGTASAAASFTIDPLRLDTVASKRIIPSEVWAVPGASATIALSGKVTDDSTTGSTKLVLSDPADPAASTAFWNAFAPTAVRNTDIPECTALTVRYWSRSAGAWVDLPGSTSVAGPVAGYTATIPANLRSDVGGVQFDFRPTPSASCASLLPPGFAVLPNLTAEVRDYGQVLTTYANDVQSAVNNPVAIEPDKTADASASVNARPINGGPGPDFVDKQWVGSPRPVSVPALSQQSRTARLLWSTQGLNLSSMTLSDPSTQGQLDSVATSVYDAWDLVRIAPITTATDPLISQVVVSKVELYSGSASAWVDITAQACANGCTGAFGGYTLSDQQQGDTLGVRLTLSERTSGEGIGSSYDRRPLDLDYRLRDTLRSAPNQYVLGQYHSYGYNTGQPGFVDNTVLARGQNPSIAFDSSSSDNDQIQIVDSPVNVSLTKTFDQDVLGLPDAGTPAEDYPLISGTIVSRNDTVARISSMVIDDPSPTQTGPSAYDTLNLYSIDTLTPPQALTDSDIQVTLTREGGIVDAPISSAAARALTAAQLADVIGVSVRFADPSGRPVIVAADASSSADTGTLGLTWQLRSTSRSTGQPISVTGTPVVNIAHTALDSPDRIPCVNPNPSPACSTGETTASDSFSIVAADYTITGTKRIAPATRAENASKSYTTTLTGRPTGNARTELMVVSDSTPTFWNTMTYSGARITLPRPVNQVAMDVLVDDGASRDVAYSVVGGELVATCNGVPLSDSSPCWVTQGWVSGTPGSVVTFSLPSGVSAGEVVGTRFRAQEVDANGTVVVWERPYNPNLSFTVSTTRRDFLRNDPSVPVSTTRPGLAPNPGESTAGRITNTVVVVGNARFGPSQTFTRTVSDTTSTLVTHLQNKVAVTKTRGTNATVAASSPVNYVMTVRNDGQWDMQGFSVVDQITPVDGSSPLVTDASSPFTFAVSGSGAPAGSGGFSGSLDPVTGTLSVTNSDPSFVFKTGWTLTITTPLRFRPGLSSAVNVANAVTVTSDRIFDTCDSTTTDLVPNATTTNVTSCTANTDVAPRSSATVALKKWVKGDQAGDPAVPGEDDLGVLNATPGGGAASACSPAAADDGFYSYPCTPITRPGGEETWRLDFLNTGNANAKVIAAVDTLPAVGDRGVIVNQARESQFPVSLVGKVEADVSAIRDADTAVVQTYYSTARLSQACNDNAIRVHTFNVAPSASCAFNWTLFDATTPESTLADAQSIMFVVTFTASNAAPAPGLAPGETLSLRYDTRTPFVLPKETAIASGASIAYNSFAGSSRSVATSTQPERPELPLEPQRVGVATVTGQLHMTKTVQAPQFSGGIALPSSYPLLVACTSGGQTVTLLNAAGGDASRPAVAADGTTLIYDDPTGPVNLPLFATCSVTEDPVPPGVTVSITPNSAVTAERNLALDPRVYDGYAGDPSAVEFAITNEYTAGGFTVTKAVDNGGAVDQDGTPIAYNSAYTFAASCTYLDQEAVAQADRTFTLRDGESKTVTGLPTGADCTVTETDTAGAASTSVNSVVQTGTPTARFTVAEGVAGQYTAAFVNTYTVGSVEITKNVTGAGAAAWGQGDFTVQFVCTLPAATSNPVYSATRTVSAADPVWTVEDLPTGSTCATAETDDAGATQSTVSAPTVTVAAAATSRVAVTNDFRVGGLNVSKTVEGPGAADFGRGPFTFSIVCSYEGATVVTTTLQVTGDGTAGPFLSTTVSTIPVGAECVVTETGDGGADVTPAPVTVTIPDEVAGTPQVVTAGFLNDFSVAQITLTKTLDGDAATAEWATSAQFGVLVTCEVQPASGPRVTVLSRTYTVGGGQTVTLTDAAGDPVRLPVATHCFGEETVSGGATRTAINADSYDNALVVAPGAQPQTLELAAINTFAYGSLQLTKKVVGTAPAGQLYRLAVSCVLPQGGDTPTVLRDGEEITIAADQTVTIDRLPAGALCWATETDTGGASRVSIDHSTQAMPALAGETTPGTILVTNTFDPPLPATGTNSAVAIVASAMGGVLLLGGLVALILRRRRRTD